MPPSIPSSYRCISLGSGGSLTPRTYAKAQQFEPDRDRLIMKYPMPPEVAPGWRLAASIMIPDSSLSTRSRPESGKVQWWPEPGAGCVLIYQLWITASREADNNGLAIAQVGCAGSFFLPDGGSLFLIVDATDDPHIETEVASARQQQYNHNKERGLSMDEDYFSYGVGGTESFDIPALVDLGNLERLRMA